MKQLVTLFSKLPEQQKSLFIIGLFAVMRGAIAFTMELGSDEAYYWLYSLDLKTNYFDHPPMVAYWIRLFTLNLSLQNIEGFIRLGSVLGCAVASWFLFKTCKLLHSPRAGYFAVCFYNASFYAGVTAGIFIMPDSPQMVFYTMALWYIARLSINDTRWSDWIGFGIAAGLCIMSKVHGVFLWAGLGLFTLLLKREWLAKPQPYVAALCTLFIISPIIIWNVKYNFATYRFHSDRVVIHNDELNLVSWMQEIISQIFFNNPFTVAVTLLALFAYIGRKKVRKTALTIYNFIGLPLAFTLLIISLFRDTILPHWSGPAYVAMIPMASIYLARKSNIRFPKIVMASMIGYVVFLISWQIVLYNYPGTYGNKSTASLGKGDVTLDKTGRRAAAAKFAVLYNSEVAAGIMPAQSPIVYYKWWAAHIEYYFARPLGIPVIGVGSLYNLHEYLWMNSKRLNKVNLSKAYCITPSEDVDDMNEHYLPYYSSIKLITIIKGFRGGKPARNFFVYRLSGYKNNAPVVKRTDFF